MKHNKKAFTLAEALILLLIAALIAAALVPVITRKHKEVEQHGKWICSINNNGKHVIKTIYRGKTSDFMATGSECIFNPPADAKNFTIKAVGGGGGGAGGKQGEIEAIYDSGISGSLTYAGSIKKDGHYTISYVGAGGGGGGMACGNPQSYVPIDLSDEDVFLQQSRSTQKMWDYQSPNKNDDWNWDMENQTVDNDRYNTCKGVGEYPDKCNIKSPTTDKTYAYGYFDKPVTGFEYKLLTQNDKHFTDKYETLGNGGSHRLTDAKGQFTTQTANAYEFKYHYLDNAGDLKGRALCFAEKNWVTSKNQGTDIINDIYQTGIYLKDKNKNNYKLQYSFWIFKKGNN